jgi:hypothetical protein
MTRNSELYLEDIFGCKHEPETPIIEQGEIIYWMCRCGLKIPIEELSKKSNKEKKTTP